MNQGWKLSSETRQRKSQTDPSKDEQILSSKNGKKIKSQSWFSLCRLTGLIILAHPVLLLIGVLTAVPSPIDPVEIELSPPPKLEGILKPNNHLVKLGKRLYEGKLRGPESIVYHKGHIYTGTADGKVLDIVGNDIKVLATLGKPPCGSYEDEPHCGRPLGMRIDKDGLLIVIDVYLGMYKINVQSGAYTQMFPASMEVDGKPVGFMNDMDIASDGTIYFTDTSKFQWRDLLLDMFEGRPHGRFLKHDPILNKTEVLLKNLYYSNGVQIAKDETFVLFTESTISRIQKYYLKGPKAGQTEIFSDNLPGIIDNIRPCRSGGYWITIGMCRHADQFNLGDFLANKPLLRGQIAKFPSKYMMRTLPHCGMIIQLSESGKMMRSLQDLTGERLAFISQVEDVGDFLYLASLSSPYIGKVDISKMSAGKAQ